MKKEKFLFDYAEIKAKHLSYRIAIIFFGIVVLVNTYFVWDSKLHKQVVIVPVGLDTHFTIENNKASNEYYVMMVRYICSLVLNYTPSSAKNNFAEYLKLYDSRSFPLAQSEFAILLKNIEESNISSVFQIDKIEVKKNVIQIEGVITQHYLDKQYFKGKKTYFLNYHFVNGKFVVDSLSEGL